MVFWNIFLCSPLYTWGNDPIWQTTSFCQMGYSSPTTQGPIFWGYCLHTPPGQVSWVHTPKLQMFQINHVQIRFHVRNFRCIQDGPPTNYHQKATKCMVKKKYIYIYTLRIPSRELTYPPKMVFWVDDFPFPKVGYVSFQEGIYVAYIYIYQSHGSYGIGK